MAKWIFAGFCEELGWRGVLLPLLKEVGIITFSIEAIALSFIYGFLSEWRIGQSIWTFVTLHAVHNVLGVLISSSINSSNYALLDDGGYLIVTMIVCSALGLRFFSKKLHQ